MTWTGRNKALRVCFSRDEMERMLRDAGVTPVVRCVPKDAILWWESVPHEFTYYLLQGMIEIFTHDLAGRKKTIDRYGPESFVGLHILKDDSLPMSTAQVIEDAQLMAIPKGSFYQVLHGSPEFTDVVLKYLFGLLTMQTREVINSSFYITAQRVPLLLLELAEDAIEAGEATGDDVMIDCSNNQIADFLGVSRNSVSSSLLRLQDQGVIEKQRGRIRIVDLVGLRRLATEQPLCPEGF